MIIFVYFWELLTKFKNNENIFSFCGYSCSNDSLLL